MRTMTFLSAFFLVVGGLAATQDGGADVKQLSKNLNKGLKGRSVANVQKALEGLVEINSPESVKAICSGLSRAPTDDPTIYWMVVDAASSVTSKEALGELGEYLARNSKKPYARDVVYALQNNRSPYLAVVLGRMLEKGPDACQMMAAEFLADVPTKAAVDVLVAKLEKLDKKPSLLRDRVLESLMHVIGKNLGEKATAYKEWWEANRERINESALGKGLAKTKRRNTGTAVDTLPPGRKEIERLRKATIVVLTSDCPHAGHKDAHSQTHHDLDQMQDLLDKMDMVYTLVKKSNFDKFDLRGRTALLVNCNQWRPFDHGKTCKSGGFSGMRLHKCVGPGPHLNRGHKLSKIGVKKIQQYVESGGYLFTEDWVLPELLERAWPNLVRTGKYLKGMKAPVTPAPGVASHPYLRRIFAKLRRDGKLTTKTSLDFEKIKHIWTIDNESPSIRIVGGQKVIKLMVSKEVGEQTMPGRKPDDKKNKPIILECGTCGAQTKVTVAPTRPVTHTGCGGQMTLYQPPKIKDAPPTGDDATAITFFPGASPKTVIGTGGFEQDRGKMKRGGRVVHVLSHFGKQQSQDDEYALQNLLLNFLIEANERQQKMKRRKR